MLKIFQEAADIFSWILLQIESIICLRCRPRNPNPRIKRIMPELRFTELPALSVDPRVGISRSASETDD